MNFKNVTAVVIMASSIIACNKSPKADNATTTSETEVVETSGQNYSTDSTSIITWTGSSIDGGHTGTFKVKDGNFIVNDDNITGGVFTIDINSLDVQEITVDDGKNDLIGHLKSPDFFEAEKFPSATFEITEVKPFVDENNKQLLLKNATHTISGNLTMKGVTKNISFPAIINLKEYNLSISTEFSIDRSNWGLSYKGQNNPKDWIISKDVTIKFSLKANK